MSVIRDILGHVEIQTAAAKRTCHHNRKKHGITKGQRHLAIFNGDGERKNYCLLCAMEILNLAETKLLGMKQEIMPPPSRRLSG